MTHFGRYEFCLKERDSRTQKRSIGRDRSVSPRKCLQIKPHCDLMFGTRRHDKHRYCAQVDTWQPPRVSLKLGLHSTAQTTANLHVVLFQRTRDSRLCSCSSRGLLRKKMGPQRLVRLDCLVELDESSASKGCSKHLPSKTQCHLLGVTVVRLVNQIFAPLGHETLRLLHLRFLIVILGTTAIR